MYIVPSLSQEDSLEGCNYHTASNPNLRLLTSRAQVMLGTINLYQHQLCLLVRVSVTNGSYHTGSYFTKSHRWETKGP